MRNQLQDAFHAHKMKTKSLFIITFFSVAVITAVSRISNPSDYEILVSEDVDSQTSNDAFHKMMDVLTHQRCMNCHPTDNIPKQGNDRHPHYFGIAGGANDHGFEATKCATCHQSENNLYSGVPGAPHWALAPASMGWEGLSRTEIAERMLNPETNGGKDHDALVKHMTEDELVLWAWNPGVDASGIPRKAPPVSEAEFKAAVEQWFADGAVIPSE